MNDSHFHRAVRSRVGEVLGSYQITEPISAGGMGTVYRAQHSLLGRPAAIKLLRPDLTDNHELVARFFNEAKAAGALRHPGIIEVFDFGFTDDGQAFLCMELLEGLPLSERLKDERFAEINAAVIARGIASALGAAHAKGIIHRDLKPDNIFLVPDPDVSIGERPKLLDFGIAKLNDGGRRHTQTGALIGTPMYMAPEQAQAATAVDHRADLYSLGCILYEMMVGEPPFVAEGAGEIIAMQMFASPQHPSQRMAAVSGELEEITLKLLAKEPKDRYQSAQDVVQALTAMLGRTPGQVISARGSAPAIPKRARTAYTGPAEIMSPTARADGPIPRLPMVLTDAGPEAPRPRSMMPVVAAVLTLALVGAGVWFVVTRQSNANADVKEQTQQTQPQPPSNAPAPTPAPTQDLPPTPQQHVEESKPVEPPTPPPPPPKQVKGQQGHKQGVVDVPIDHGTGKAVTAPPKDPPKPNGETTGTNQVPIESTLEGN